MVGSRHGDDELACPLIARTDLDAFLLQPRRAEQGDELEHEVGLLFEELWCSLLYSRFELEVVVAWNGVPCLGLAKVMVVDAAQSPSL
jgi:hypothetical protein